MKAHLEKADSKQKRPGEKPSGIFDYNKAIEPPLGGDSAEMLWVLFEECAFHGACINAKVVDSVGRGWHLEPEDDSEEGAEAGDDAAAVERKLRDDLEAVCPELSFTQLCKQALREMEAIGWAAWEVLRDKAGDPTTDVVGLLPMPAHTIRRVRTAKGEPVVFLQVRGEDKVFYKAFAEPRGVSSKDGKAAAEGADEDVLANEIIFFKDYTPRSPYYGIPEWVSCVAAIAELASIREFNMGFFESGGMADRLFHAKSSDVKVAEDLIQNVKTQIEETKGRGHLNLMAYSDNDTDLEVMGLEPKSQGQSGRDHQFRAGKDDLIAEVLVAHQVPPYRVGIAATGSLGGSTAEEMSEDYRQGIIEPRQELMEGILSRTIFGEAGFPTPGWKVEFENLASDQDQVELDEVMRGVEFGVFSPNDGREKLGEERVEDPGMDAYYMKGQAISEDEAGASGALGVLGELRDALNANVAAPEVERSLWSRVLRR